MGVGPTMWVTVWQSRCEGEGGLVLRYGSRSGKVRVRVGIGPTMWVTVWQSEGEGGDWSYDMGNGQAEWV